ncbi:unnamed protein product [Lymnaea stagnalis]|uniref:Uncharacterized protein n=1 Tax=Lymnaea stagnalis TaxID=6523 RepID=A0AAV2HKH2_LYMST
MAFTALNLSIFLLLFVSFLSPVHCSNSTDDSSYSCFQDDQCQDRLNASNFYRDNVTYCCDDGDALKISITGPNFRYESSSYDINYRTQKRDESNPADVNPDNGTQFKCTCQVITSDYLNQILKENEKYAQESQNLYNRISKYFEDEWGWKSFWDRFR